VHLLILPVFPHRQIHRLQLTSFDPVPNSPSTPKQKSPYFFSLILVEPFALFPDAKKVSIF
jgi:hypothetical protein